MKVSSEICCLCHGTQPCLRYLLVYTLKCGGRKQSPLVKAPLSTNSFLRLAGPCRVPSWCPEQDQCAGSADPMSQILSSAIAADKSVGKGTHEDKTRSHASPEDCRETGRLMVSEEM